MSEHLNPSLDPRLPPAPELALAAVERAIRHDRDARRAVSARAILAHLGIRPRSAAARGLAPVLAQLCADGLLAHERRRGVPRWALTGAGRELARRRRRGLRRPALPESPQHAAWRGARRTAALEIARLRGVLAGTLAEGRERLAAPRPPHSDDWLALGERLRGDCRRMASASHCLYEWPEPNDERADVDTHVERERDAGLDTDALARRRALRAGRRNTTLWRENR